MLSHEDQIVAAIRKIIRAVDLHSRRLVNGHGLTGPQLAVLKEVSRLGPTSPSALARSVHLSQATVTGIVQRLARRELVSRQPSPEDRRSVLIGVTAEGKALLDDSPSLLQDRFRESLQGLEEWERLQMLATLQRIATLMDADQLDAAPHLTSGRIAADHPADEKTAADGKRDAQASANMAPTDQPPSAATASLLKPEQP